MELQFHPDCLEVVIHLCPSSGVFHCTFGTGKFHAGFDDRFQAVRMEWIISASGWLFKKKD
jgi:hypothetical protein